MAFLCSMVFAFAATLTPALGQTAGVSNYFRIGFSTTSMAAVNVNDAKAAVTAWAQSLIRDRGLVGKAEASVLPPEQVIADFRENRLDAANLTTPEFLKLDPSLIGHIFVGLRDNEAEEVYVILARQADNLKALADLRGKRLMALENNRAALARLWLDRALAEAGLPVAGDFFKPITTKDKVSTVVLPVFFGAADACLVTRRGFRVMTELNPQVGRQLREIAASPPLLPSLVCIRADYAAPNREVVLDAIHHAGNNPASQQLLTVFQIGDLAEQPLSAVDATREFILACEHLPRADHRPPAPAAEASAPNP